METRYRQLIEDFSSGALKEEDFHHKEHLAVTMWALLKEEPLVAIVHIKGGILYYNRLFNVPQKPGRGYHETVTLFFIRLMQAHLKEVDANLSFDEKFDQFCEKYPDFRQTLKTFYSREVLNDEKARVYWVEPDKKPLP